MLPIAVWLAKFFLNSGYSFKICFFNEFISLLISLILALFCLIFLSSNDANLSNPCLSVRRDEYFFTLFDTCLSDVSSLDIA